MDSQITFDETLSEAVRDFPVIYDTSSGHKYRFVQNAWKQVSQRVVRYLPPATLTPATVTPPPRGKCRGGEGGGGGG